MYPKILNNSTDRQYEARGYSHSETQSPYLSYVQTKKHYYHKLCVTELTGKKPAQRSSNHPLHKPQNLFDHSVKNLKHAVSSSRRQDLQEGKVFIRALKMKFNLLISPNKNPQEAETRRGS